MKLNILCLEPFYGGSHKAFIDGLIEHSDHDYTLHTLPSRFWKWRMRGAALHFFKEIENPESYDLLLTCGLMSLADLKALWGSRCPPTVVYLHETQLSYPLQEGEKMDYQFGFTDISTGLTAEKLIFNSGFHMEKFLNDLPGFIKKMPEFKPHWAVELIRQKSKVLYPGCSLPPFSEASPVSEKRVVFPDVPRKTASRPLIIWNHRWEYDKDPAAFFAALYALDAKGCKFNIALLGENYQKVPKEFIKAKEYFGERVLRYGWCDSRTEYEEWLDRGDFIVSTSIQENFGISIVEAVARGCFPLLPERLSYPELVPKAYHETCLYRPSASKDAVHRAAPLCEKLETLLRRWNINEGDSLRSESVALRKHYARFSWERLIRRYDKLFEEVYMVGFQR